MQSHARTKSEQKVSSLEKLQKTFDLIILGEIIYF